MKIEYVEISIRPSGEQFSNVIVVRQNSDNGWGIESTRTLRGPTVEDCVASALAVIPDMLALKGLPTKC